eukprot:5087282-Lingulodinium_polyedra.AAC.1
MVRIFAASLPVPSRRRHSFPGPRSLRGARSSCRTCDIASRSQARARAIVHCGSQGVSAR